MIAAVLAKVLVGIAVAILRWWAIREEAKHAERATFARLAAEAAQRALAYKAEHPVAGDLDGLLDAFRVRDPGPKRVELSPDDPGPPGPGEQR